MEPQSLGSLSQASFGRSCIILQWRPRIASQLKHTYVVIVTSSPGIPLILMGRNKDISFTFTYGMLDMGDYFLENIKDQNYERDGHFLPLTSRTVTVNGKTSIFYETAEGHIIERITEHFSLDIADGVYLAVRVPDRDEEEELIFMQSFLPFARTVQEAQELVPQTLLGSNYLFADVAGNIGYQQTGSVPLRPTSNGLLPLPAWNSSNLWTGRSLF